MPPEEGTPAAIERRRIECVTRAPGAEPKIAAIGGTDGGAAWAMSEAEAIKAIDEEKISFYVIVGGSARVVIVGERLGVRYLKSDGDHRAPNHLLALADCPEDING